MTMRALHLDFQRVYRPVPWLGLGLLLAAPLALGMVVGHYQAVTAEMRLWEGKAEQAARRSAQGATASRALSEQAARAQVIEVNLANQVVHQLRLPWNTLFTAVEAAARPDIALLALEPDMQNGSVKIGGEAKDFDALLSYVKDLSKREVFGTVVLQNHQIQRDVPEKPVRFNLIAQWRGGAS